MTKPVLALGVCLGVLMGCTSFPGREPTLEHEFNNAAARGDFEQAQKLLDQGADIDRRFQGEGDGYTTLMMASGAGALSLVRFLLDRGADPNIRSNNGCTALMVAAKTANTEALRLLLEAGADSGAKSDAGLTALDYARDPAFDPYKTHGREEAVALLESWAATSAR